jgi:HK97 family phage major capsid protein
VFGIDDIWALTNALPARWRKSNPQWLASLDVYHKARAFGTTGPKSPNLWLTLGDTVENKTILGAPARETSEMTADTTTTGALPLIFGDFSGYFVVDHLQSFMLSDNVIDVVTGRPTGERLLHMAWRVGGKVIVPQALRILEIS